MMGSVIHKADAKFGDHCYVGEFNRIGFVDVGDYFMSSSHVVIVSGLRGHGFARRDLPMRLQTFDYQRLAIGCDVWVGVGAVIGCDVASHTIVAAGAMVNSTFDEWLVLGGVPARTLGERP